MSELGVGSNDLNHGCLVDHHRPPVNGPWHPAIQVQAPYNTMSHLLLLFFKSNYNNHNGVSATATWSIFPTWTKGPFLHLSKRRQPEVKLHTVARPLRNQRGGGYRAERESCAFVEGGVTCHTHLAAEALLGTEKPLKQNRTAGEGEGEQPAGGRSEFRASHQHN